MPVRLLRTYHVFVPDITQKDGCLDKESSEISLVVGAVSLWETRRVFQGLWEGGEAGFPQTARVTAMPVTRRPSDPAPIA